MNGCKRTAFLVVAWVAVLSFVNQVSGGNKCEESELAKDTFEQCLDEESSGTISVVDFVTMEKGPEKDELFTKVIICFLKKFAILDDQLIVHQDALMRAMPQFMVTDNQTMQKCELGYKACFVGFNSTVNETYSILKCTNMITEWACEKPTKCNPDDGPKQYCKLSNTLLQAKVDCDTQYADRDKKHLCVLRKSGLIDQYLNLNEERIRQFFTEDAYSENEVVQDKITTTVQKCLDMFANYKDLQLKAKATLMCLFEDTKKICEGQEHLGLITNPNPEDDPERQINPDVLPGVVEPENELDPQVPESLAE